MAKKLSTAEKARRMWVRALRSGKYGWGKDHLHPSEGKFCCLGVLCEVAIEQGIISAYDGQAGGVPEKVKKWVGLHNNSGDYGIESLAIHNDDAKCNPFAKIATLIEKNPEGLFVEDLCSTK